MAKAAYLFITMLFAVGTQIANSKPLFSKLKFAQLAALQKARQEAHQNKVFAQQEALQKQVSAQQEAIQKQVSAQQEAIQKQVSAQQEAIQKQVFAQQQSIWDQSNQVDSDYDDADEPASASSSFEVRPQDM